VSRESPTRPELLERIARAIREAPARLGPEPRSSILLQLRDVEARLRAGETLDQAYRQSLSFHVVATRELDDVEDTHGAYLDLLSELAFDLDRAPPR
jgi:hypothetical protein